MQTLFHGLRRKVGLATLVLAIGLTVVCVRLAQLPDGLRRTTEHSDSVVRCDLHGIHFEKTYPLDEYGQIRGVYATPQWTLPHYSIIGPLIMLSGYLLLVPSRKRPPASQTHA